MNLLPDIEFMRSKVDMEEYYGAHVLITGASGFFGSWLTYALNGKCVLTLANRDNITACLKGDYDYIFHFAPCAIEPILDCATRNMARILYASSGAVYGITYTRPREDDILNPKTEYGIKKMRDEILIKGSGLDYIIARCYAFAGPQLRDYFALTAFVKAVKAENPLTLFNRGLAVRSYLYGADLAVWLLNLMLKGVGIYNVGSERETTIKELAELVASFTIPHAKIVNDPKPFVEPAPYYVPDCRKAHKLDLYQWHDIEYSVRRMFE
jgi:nucleoside-diphosphate-sugar epimerase